MQFISLFRSRPICLRYPTYTLKYHICTAADPLSLSKSSFNRAYVCRGNRKNGNVLLCWSLSPWGAPRTSWKNHALYLKLLAQWGKDLEKAEKRGPLGEAEAEAEMGILRVVNSFKSVAYCEPHTKPCLSMILWILSEIVRPSVRNRVSIRIHVRIRHNRSG